MAEPGPRPPPSRTRPPDGSQGVHAGWDAPQAALGRPGASRPPSAADKRIERLKGLEETIGEHLRESERMGELRQAPSFGRPMDFGDGYAQTPAELRMPMKVLKNAGIVPAEVEMLQRLAALREAAGQAADPQLREQLARRANDLQLAIALRLERLRSGSL